MAAGDYADLKWLKRKLVISDEDDDPDLNASIESANTFVSDILFRHSATLPVTGDLKTSAGDVANCEAMRDYKLTKQDIETSKEWRAARNEKSKGLIARLDADPNTNTQGAFVAVSTAYKTEPMKSRNS